MYIWMDSTVRECIISVMTSRELQQQAKATHLTLGTTPGLLWHIYLLSHGNNNNNTHHNNYMKTLLYTEKVI